MIGSIPVKIHNFPKDEADDEDASAGGDFGSSDSENSVSKIDEFAKATEYRSVPVDHMTIECGIFSMFPIVSKTLVQAA